ncbi:MAG TPA: peptidyl-prolyl cis-trans isomerase [Solirubrobacteraceae bacterium]|nr:peptidyl-prolyl cis-trans isomerase [Solirubrobacteraceae bacterium]
MKVRSSFLALGAFFVIAVGMAGCGSDVSGDAVANVAGNPITTQAFNHWMYVAAKSQAAQNPGQPVIVPNDPPNFDACVAQVKKDIPSLAKTKTATLQSDCKQLFTSLSSQVLDFLIKAYWYQADAAKMGIKVTDAQVQKAFDTAKKAQFPTASGYNTFLSQTGQTTEDVLFRFRINEILQKLAAKHTTSVTPAAIKAFYESHLSQFGSQETRNMKIVLAKNAADANAAKKALESGQSWATVVKKYSTDPTTKSTGGVLNGVNKQQEDAALSNAAFSAPVNKLEGPVKGQFGYYVFEVTKITPSTQQSLAQATALIKQQLTSQSQTNAQTAVDNKAKKDWLSQTTCRAAYAMADCKGYTAPKTATTTSGSATTG